MWTWKASRIGMAVGRVLGKPPTRIGIAACIGILCIVIGGLIASKMLAGPADGLLVPRDEHLVWKGLAREEAPARATFKLDNVGHRSVHVLSVESGCGCARPSVYPTTVGPGETATVDVIALAVPIGAKVVPFIVRTDSPVRSEVPLTLKLIGTRKPPFLYMMEGEPIFLGGYSPEMRREIAVLTIENPDRKSPPLVSSDLPFLKTTFKGMEEKPFIEPGAFVRRWKYDIEFKERPPSGTFHGTLTARVPWDPVETKKLNLVG